MHNNHENNKIHNISFVGKDGTGKSKLVNAILKLKSKKDDSEIVEYPEEIERGYTIYNRYYHFDRGDFSYNLIDTPGNTNFLPKIKTAASVSNGAVIVISPTSPNESAFRIWQRVAESNTARLLFINSLDDPEAKFDNAINDIEIAFSTKPVVLQMPWYEDGKLTGVIDIIKKKLIKGTPGKLKEEDAPDSVKENLELLRATTIERLAEMDDELMELYIEEQEPPMELLLKVLAKGVAECSVTPLLVGSARENIGVVTLCDFIETYFTNFEQLPAFKGKASKAAEAEVLEIKPDRNEPFCGRVFKTLYDRYAGKLSFVQVISGTLAKGTKVINIEESNKLQIGRISVISGETTEEVDIAYPGDIIVLEKEDSLSANQTICDPSRPVILDPINFLKARYTKKLIMTNSSKDSRIMDALHKVVAEDPGLRISTNKDTKEILFSGTGIMHVDVTKEHLNNAYEVEIELGTPALGFKETITRQATVQGKYKKQSGGHGQYGDVHIKVEPLPRGGGFEFVNSIVGGSVPKNYIPSVEKGVVEGLLTGSLGRFPVVDVKVTLFDGSYHAVDSSDFAFQAAGLMAIKKALPEAAPVILEPVMEVDIDVSEEDVGKISKDVASRRGKINNYDYGEYTSIVNADIPLSEMQDYTPTLRGMTQGMGLFKMKLSSYEILQGVVANKIIASRKTEDE